MQKSIYVLYVNYLEVQAHVSLYPLDRYTTALRRGSLSKSQRLIDPRIISFSQKKRATR